MVCVSIGISFHSFIFVVIDDNCARREVMTFDNTTIGLLLFYTAGGLIAVTIALIYYASKRGRKR